MLILKGPPLIPASEQKELSRLSNILNVNIVFIMQMRCIVYYTWIYNIHNWCDMFKEHIVIDGICLRNTLW